MTLKKKADPTAAPRLAPDPDAKVIYSLGELDGIAEGVAVPVLMEGPITPPYDEIGSALDRAYRVGLKTSEVKTDGRVRRVTEAVQAMAAELGYYHVGHSYAGRFQPNPRVKKSDRDIRLEWHLRTAKIAGLEDADVQELHRALALPDRGEDWERSCDELDRRNEAGSRANLSGETDGTQWRIVGPTGFHWPVFRLVATLPDGREISGRMDLRDYVAAHLGRMLADDSGTEGAG